MLNQNLKKAGRKIMSVFLAFLVILGACPVAAYAEALQRELVYVPEIEIQEEILEGDLFYFASTQLQMEENSDKSFAVRIGRGGDVSSAASVLVKMSDFSAHYGEDYKVALLNGAKANTPDGMYSLTDLMEGEYETGTLPSEEELLEAMENNPELKEEASEAINQVVEFIEENADLKEVESFTLEDVEKEANGYTSPLSQAYKDSTGIDAQRQKVGSEGNTEALKEMQSIANLINELTVGADLKVDFEPDEESRYIVITPKNNLKAQGERYFYLSLTDPEGATVSAASTCSVTIMDDEEVGPCEVFFNGYDLSEDGKKVIVYIKRSGCLNQITDVALSTTGQGSAIIGQDYSPVETSVLFPISTPEMKIEIPVDTSGFFGTRSFELKLEGVANGVCQDEKLIVDLMGSMPLMASGMFGDTTTSRSLSTVALKTDGAINLSTVTPHTYHTSHYDGNNKYETHNNKPAWLLEWVSTHSVYGGGKVSAAFKYGTGYYYAGVQSQMDRTGSCADFKVGFGDSLAVDESGSGSVWSDGVEQAFDSDRSLGLENFFDPRDIGFGKAIDNTLTIAYVKYMNRANCHDCNRIWIQSITPIYRWFDLTVISKETPTFLTANGTYEPIPNADQILIMGSSTEQTNRMLVHLDETHKIYLPYGGDYLNLTKIDDGVGIANTVSAQADGSYNWKMTEGLLGSMFFNRTMKFADNTVQRNDNGTFPQYGYGTVYAEFTHKPATVVVKAADGFQAGQLTLSKTVRKPGTYNYNKGDVIRITCDNIDGRYRFVGISVKAKINSSDMNYLDEIFVSAEDGDVFLDQNKGNHLVYEYYEVTPVFEEKKNTVSIRIKETDIQKLDMTYGFFRGTNIGNYKNIYIDGAVYREYVQGDVTSSRIYSYPVKTNSSKDAPVWTVNETKYAGSVLYYQPDANPDNNVIVLSFEHNDEGFPLVELTGTIRRFEYNASTSYTGSTYKPFEGALIVCGSSEESEMDDDGNYRAAAGLSDEDGKYSVSTRVPLGYNLTYLVSYNGQTVLKEVKADSNCITQNMVLNPENGSLLSSLSIDFGTNAAAGKVIPLLGGVSTLTVSDQGGVPYKKTIVNESKQFEEVDDVERLTALRVIIRDEDGTERISYSGTKKSDGVFAVDINQEDVCGGDLIYIQVESDRAPAGMVDEYNRAVASDISPVTSYYEILTGYSFSVSTAEILPVYTKFNSVPSMDFASLPLINEIGFYVNFPFVHVNIEKRGDSEYLMSIGVSVMDIVDSAKKEHINSYSNGALYDDYFSTDQSSMISKWTSGLKNSAKLISNMRTSAKEGVDTTSALGGGSWRFNIAVGAYMKFEIVNNTGNDNLVFYLTGVGGYIGAQGGFRWNIYWAMPVVCIPMYFGVQVELMVNGFFGTSVDPSTLAEPITLEDAQRRTIMTGELGNFDSSVKAVLTGSVYVGVGICGTLGVRGGGQVVVMTLWQPSDIYDDWGADIVFKAGIWLDLFVTTIPLLYSFPDIDLGSIRQARTGKLDASSGLFSIGGDSDTLPEIQFRNPYTDKASEWKGATPAFNSGFHNTLTQTLVKNPYEHPEAQLCELSSGDLLMAFIDSTGEQDAFSRTTIKISIFHDKVWSEPVEVQKDGTSDFQPRVTAMEDGKALLTWVSAEPGTEDIEDITEYLSHLEIYSAIIDISDPDLVTDVTRLTDDDYYDSNPVCVYDPASKEYAVFYVKADPFKNDGTGDFKTPDAIINPYTNDSVVAYMIHAKAKDGEEKWLTKEYFDNESVLSSEWNGQRFFAAPIKDLGIYTPAIADLTAGVYGGKAYFAYTIDADSDNDTDNDKELYMQIYDFASHKMDDPIRLSQDAVSDTLPQFVQNRDADGNSTIKLFWYRDAKRVAFINVSNLIEEGLDEKNRIKDSYRSGEDEHKDLGLERIYSYAVPDGVSDDEVVTMSGFKVVTDGKDGEDIFIIWTQMPEEDSDCVELYASSFLGSSETKVEKSESPDPLKSPLMKAPSEVKYEGSDWSRPYRLTNTKLYIDEPSVAVTSSGDLIVAYNSYMQTITDDPNNPVEISDLLLMCVMLEPCGAVDITDISVSDETPVEGDEIEVTVTLENTGLTYAEGYELNLFTKKNGKKVDDIASLTRISSMKPGSVYQETFKYTVGKDLEGTSIRGESKEIGGDWNNISVYETENFGLDAYFEISEISVWQTEEGMMAGFTAVNTGNKTSDDEDRFQITQTGPFNNNCGLEDDEHLFADVSLGGIEPGENKCFEVLLNAPSKCFVKFGYVTCYADYVKDGESISGSSITVRPVKPMEVLLNEEEIPESISMEKGETRRLTASTLPTSTDNIVFESSDESIVSFVNGVLIANGSGKAVIKGTLMPSGVEIKPIMVNIAGTDPSEPTEPTDPSKPENPDDPNSPNTGDKSNTKFWIILLCYSFACCIVLLVICKKSQKKER